MSFFSEWDKEKGDWPDWFGSGDRSKRTGGGVPRSKVSSQVSRLFIYYLAVNEIKSSVVLVIQLTIYVFSTCPIIFQSLVLLFCFTLRTVTVNYKMFWDQVYLIYAEPWLAVFDILQPWSCRKTFKDCHFGFLHLMLKREREKHTTYFFLFFWVILLSVKFTHQY